MHSYSPHLLFGDPFEFLNVAATAGQVPIDAVENLHGSSPLDLTYIGAGLRRPDDGDSLRRGLLAHAFNPNSRRISSCGMPRPRASDARACSSSAAVSGVSTSSSTSARA